MISAHVRDNERLSQEAAALCASHLGHEEALLGAVLSILRAVQAALVARGLDALTTALAAHPEFARLIEDINVRRALFREVLARRLEVAPADATLRRVLAGLAGRARAELDEDIARVGRLAEEVASTHSSVCVHLRIRLDAYRRLLRDLTNTAASSGRYGPAGRTEALDYRPLLFIHG
jgi:hypothetical protein